MAKNAIIDLTGSDEKKKRIRKYTRKWTLKSSLALIQAVQRSEIIWDAKNPRYKNRDEKSRSWNEISEAISIPKKEAILRWTVIRGNYLTYLKKENQYGSGKKVRLFNPIYSKMTFLDPMLRKECECQESSVKTSSSLAMDSSIESDSENQDTSQMPKPENHLRHQPPPKDTFMESAQANDEWAAFGNMIACNARSWAARNIGLARRYKAALSAVCAEFEKEVADLFMDDIEI